MKHILFSLLLLSAFQCTSRKTVQKPPMAKIEPVENEYFGRRIIDPYRYMENLQDSVVQKWFKVQSDYSRSVLNSISGRQALIDEMKHLDGRKSSVISNLSITENDRFFYTMTKPSDETPKLYFKDGYDGEEILLFDPDTYSTDTSEKYLLGRGQPSYDGSNVIITLYNIGEEGENTMSIIDVENRTLYPEKIYRFGYGNTSWLPDGSGFLYDGFQYRDTLNKAGGTKNTGMYLHILGTSPVEDREIFSKEKYPDLGINSDAGAFVFYDKDREYIFAVSDFARNVHYAPAAELYNEEIEWKHLYGAQDEIVFQGIINNSGPVGEDLYLRTSKDAPNYKIIKTSIKNPDLTKAEVIVSEDSQALIKSFAFTCDGMYYTLLENGVRARLYFLPFGAKEAIEISLPFNAGNISIMTKGYKFSDIWLDISGWTKDSERYRYLRDSNDFHLMNLAEDVQYPEYSDLIVEELMVESHDGIKVPLSLIYKNGIKKNGNNPVLLYGYGSFGDSEKPHFNPSTLLWTLEGGIYAVAHVRGGGELGNQWHLAGFKSTKPNTWKDMIACTEYLITEKYSSPKKIALYSSSAGGILVGRSMTDRPDLFSAVISEIGIMNSVRYEESANRTYAISEYGTVKDSAECMGLIEMDSYLNLKDGIGYPATLITTGIMDRMVPPWQSGKFAARLQAVNTSENPVLFLVDYESGHGSLTKSKQFENLADVYSFALWQIGNPKYQVRK